MINRVRQYLRNAEIHKEEHEAFIMFGIILSYILFMLIGIIVGRGLTFIM